MRRHRRRIHTKPPRVLVSVLLVARACTAFLSPTISRQAIIRKPIQVETPSLSQYMVDVVKSQTSRSVQLPPWLEHYSSSVDDSGETSAEWLRASLHRRDFSEDEVELVLDAVRSACQQRKDLFVGAIDFLLLFLSVDDAPQQLSSSTNEDRVATLEALIAAAFHYCECVAARQDGVYELVREAVLRRRKTKLPQLLLSMEAESSSSRPNDEEQQTEKSFVDGFDSQSIPALREEESTVEDDERGASMMLDADELPVTSFGGLGRTALRRNSLAQYGKEVVGIVAGAARLKRAEILAETVVPSPSRSEATNMRGMLLSVMKDDWRSLAIRSTACLYRLQGILKNRIGTDENGELTSEEVRTAREAFQVYAPLAQRLGMHRLKAELEAKAFRLLYRRQYKAASTLYRQSGEAMRSVTEHLTSQIRELIMDDDVLMYQLDEVQVSSRVKEPYSLWKKLLKIRTRDTKSSLPGTSVVETSELSLQQVPDALALRIILRARKLNEEETDDATRLRERLLCYYVQRRILSQWPAPDQSRKKDYIRYPKENGYQSLHHTSLVPFEGAEWAFEVQVRSEEMHQIAEHGLAAHWDYKLAGRTESDSPSLSLLLPQAEDTKQTGSATSSSPLSLPTAGDDELPFASQLEQSSSYIGALTSASLALSQNKVFVFFAGEDMEGTILNLPARACVGDAVYQIEKLRGVKLLREGSSPDVLRNGSVAQLEDVMGNGDVLLVDV